LPAHVAALPGSRAASADVASSATTVAVSVLVSTKVAAAATPDVAVRVLGPAKFAAAATPDVAVSVLVSAHVASSRASTAVVIARAVSRVFFASAVAVRELICGRGLCTCPI